MDEEGIEGFADVVVAPTWREGTNYIIQLTGIGGLIPNTVLLEWPECAAQDMQADQVKKDFMEVLQTALAANKAVLAVKGLQSIPTEIVHGTIDIWWMIHDGGFLILLSWFLSQHRIWRSCHLRVFTVAENVSETRAKGAAELLSRTLRERRLCDVDVEVILLDDEMIEPYTNDWTLRVEERHRFLKEVNPTACEMDLEPIPLAIDDLFDKERQEMQPKPPSQAGDSPAGAVIGRRRNNPVFEFIQKEVKVSECRTGAEGGRRHNNPVIEDCKNEVKVSDYRTGAEGGRRNNNQVFEFSQNEVKRSDCRTGAEDGRGHRHGGASSSADDAPDSSASDPQPAAAPATDDPESSPAGSGGVKDQASSPFESIELCQKLGQIINSRSKRAQLVVMNLPDVWGSEDKDVLNYMQYCDTLTQGLERVLFVRSTGREIFDISG